MEVYTFTQEELVAELNKGKELFLTTLQEEGIITKEQLRELAQYSIILAKKGVLGTIWNKFFTQKNVERYHVVRVITKWDDESKIEEDE